jgi:hypothetical protein
MDLPSRFKRFLEQIRPSSTQLNQFRRSHTALRRLLHRHPTLRRHIVTSFLQGSYRRATATRSPDDRPGSDVDLVLVTDLDPKRHPPDRVLGLLRPFLDQHYPSWRMQGRSLRIEDEVALDLVLASAPSRVGLLRLESQAEPLDEGLRPTPAELAAWQTEPLLIPDREARRWRPTHPLAQLSATREKNAACGGHYVNVVKAIKWWKLSTPGTPEHPRGYPLERLVEAYCPDDIESVAEGVTRTLEALVAAHRDGKKPRLRGHRVRGQDVLARVPATDFAAFVRHAGRAAALARRALDCRDEAESAALWRELLGPAFPTGAYVEPSATLPVARTPAWSLDSLLATLAARGQVVVAGFDEIARFKRTLVQAVQQLGIRVQWDPGTPPELRDYLGVTLLSAIEGGLAGAGIALIASTALGRAPELVRIGAAVGAVIGAVKGYDRVKAGWRLRAGYGPDGEMYLELRALR